MLFKCHWKSFIKKFYLQKNIEYLLEQDSSLTKYPMVFASEWHHIHNYFFCLFLVVLHNIQDFSSLNQRWTCIVCN